MFQRTTDLQSREALSVTALLQQYTDEPELLFQRVRGTDAQGQIYGALWQRLIQANSPLDINLPIPASNLEVLHHYPALLQGQLTGKLLVAKRGKLYTPDIEPFNVPRVTLNSETAMPILPTPFGEL